MLVEFKDETNTSLWINTKHVVAVSCVFAYQESNVDGDMESIVENRTWISTLIDEALKVQGSVQETVEKLEGSKCQ